MNEVVYSIGLFFYSKVILLASFFNPKAKKWHEGRKNIEQAIDALNLTDKKTIWMHCASVGEYEQGRPIWDKLKKEYPSSQFVLTFFSPSGYEFVRSKFPEENVLYLPLDAKKNARLWLDKINPKLVLFVKYEFWHFYLKELSNRNIHTYLISGIFRKEQVFFKPFGGFFLNILRQFSHIFVQNQESFDLLNQKKIKQVSLSGDLRYERVFENAQQEFSNERIEKFIENKKIFIAGSVWESDIPVLQKIENLLGDEWKILLVPHELDHFTYPAKENISFYSKTEHFNDKIMIVDTVGILSKLYRYGNLVYIGGGFGKGIHNTLEAAIYKKPLLFGPKFDKFEEAKNLLKWGQALVINENNVGDTLKIAHQISSETLEKAYSLMTLNSNHSEEIIVFIKKHCVL